MKYHLKSKSFCKLSLGFTLVETVVAMGIITIMITAFIAAFGPAVKGVEKSISVKEANRLASTLEHEMSVLRPSEQTAIIKTPFDKAFAWILNSNKKGILIYQYKGTPGSNDGDGFLTPFTDKTKPIAGQQYILQSVARRSDDKKVERELTIGVVEGRVFYVTMTQLVYDSSGALVPGKEGVIRDPRGSNSFTNAQNYPDAVIAFQAKFYSLKSNQASYVKKLDITKLGKPAFIRNMAVRR